MRAARYARMLMRDRLAAGAAVFLVAVLVMSFVAAPFLGPEALQQNLDLRMKAPFANFDLRNILGTDALGRSVMFRLIAAGQTSLSIALAAVVISATLGVALGIYAGFRRGVVDTLAMRGADVIMSFPLLLLAILFLYLLEPRPGNIVALLALGRLPLYLRTARAETLEVSKRLFVDAARCLGASRWWLCAREIAPVVAPSMLTLMALDVGLLMLIESALSFLGIGIQPPAVSWGLMVADGRQYVRNAWWLTFIPGAAIFLTALSFNLLSNWLRLATDPAQSWRLEAQPAAVAPPAAEPRQSAPAPAPAAEQTVSVLAVENLHVGFNIAGRTVSVVRGVDLAVERGETLVILGESGSGKSVTSRAILGLIQPPGFVETGRVSYLGRDLLTMPDGERRTIQGDRIAMIFQDALAALNPVFSVGWQIAELHAIHRGMPMAEGYRRAEELLRRVGIPNAATRVHDYAHQFSGGMRQRVMIAMAIALEPDILLADEPTTALDVTVQAQIMQLLARLRREQGLALVLITHDMAVASEVADRIAVMYAGRIVETGHTADLLRAPAHPYTRALVALAVERSEQSRTPIPGTPPDMTAIPAGCAFHPRCAFAEDICRSHEPPLRGAGERRLSACHFAEKVAALA